MKLPQSIKFMGRTIDVKVVQESEIPGLSGQYSEFHAQIRIAESSEQQMAITFMHEIIEMINTSMEDGMEHPQINRFAECLFHVLRENKLEF